MACVSRYSVKDGGLIQESVYLIQKNVYLLMDSFLLQHAVAENNLTHHTCRMSSYGIPEAMVQDATVNLVKSTQEIVTTGAQI